MSACYLQYDLLRLNASELRRRAERPRPEPILIRAAGAGDTGALRLLAELDCAPELIGEVLLAEIRGEPWAALELASGRIVADPFRPGRDVSTLLRARAATLRRSARPRRIPAFMRLRADRVG